MDNILFACKGEKEVLTVKTQIAKECGVEDKREVRLFFGMGTDSDEDIGASPISQVNYVHEKFNHFEMKLCYDAFISRLSN